MMHEVKFILRFSRFLQNEEKFVKFNFLGTEYEAKACFHVPTIRQTKDCTVVKVDEFSSDLCWIDGNGTAYVSSMITTPIMLVEYWYDVTSIYPEFYINILKYWEEIGMDEIIEDADIDSFSLLAQAIIEMPKLSDALQLDVLAGDNLKDYIREHIEEPDKLNTVNEVLLALCGMDFRQIVDGC